MRPLAWKIAFAPIRLTAAINVCGSSSNDRSADADAAALDAAVELTPPPAASSDAAPSPQQVDVTQSDNSW